jgi:enolase-phosphatase E1
MGDLRAIILDIEGTTTPISFVYETLFPYARRNLRAHFEAHGNTPEGLALLARLRQQRELDARADAEVPPWSDATLDARYDSVVSYVGWLMDRDRKSTPLKDLQGRIWEAGYRTGELVGEVFADVPPALARWHQQRVHVGVFSSGSVLAQRLLFRHSTAGDLTGFLRWHFDTTTGAKTDADTYGRIATTIGIAPASILFVSDVVRELDAARDAGWRTALAIRPGNAPTPAGHDNPTITSFEGLTSDVA